jgi:hypothetical protein
MQTTTPGGSGSLHDPHGSAAAVPISAAGGPEDPIMHEALRLIEAFLAIEDAAARSALITLAEGLVSYDWVRKVQRRR